MGTKIKRSKPAVKYQGFALEIPLIDEIKKHITNNPDFRSYRSVTDFVRTAIREKLAEDKRTDRLVSKAGSDYHGGSQLEYSRDRKLKIKDKIKKDDTARIKQLEEIVKQHDKLLKQIKK